MSRVTKDEIERTFNTEYASMLNYAVNLSRDRDVAEDLISEVFSNVLRNPPALQEGKTLTDYMVVSIRNGYFDGYVKSYYHSRTIRLGHLELDQIDEFLKTEAGAYDPYEDNEMIEEQDRRIEIFRESLKGLTRCQRDILTCRILKGLTAEETARALNKTVGATKMSMSRAYSSLREILLTQGIKWKSRAPIIHGESYYGVRRGYEVPRKKAG
jgi:RNA polymerase sigma-70 factor (ECF subfamily)